MFGIMICLPELKCCERGADLRVLLFESRASSLRGGVQARAAPTVSLCQPDGLLCGRGWMGRGQRGCVRKEKKTLSLIC